MRTEFLCIYVLRVASGPRVKLASCKSFVCFSVCVVMLALWSPSSIAAHFAFCFTSCFVMLAFWSLSTAAHFAFCFNCCD